MTVMTAGRVVVSIDDEAGEGWMTISPEASTGDIRKALAYVDEHGYEELDSFETGDPLEEDDAGRTLVPLVRIGG